MVDVSLRDKTRRPRKTPHHRGSRLWIVGVLLGLAITIGGGIAVRALIDAYHSRVALAGFTASTEPVSLDLNGQALIVPANMLRFASARQGGAVDRVDLILHWPSLDGFAEVRAEAFKDTGNAAPLIFATLREPEIALDPVYRLHAIYQRYFDGPAASGPAGLIARRLDDTSPYRGEVIYYDPDSRGTFVVRCLARATTEIPATCLRDMTIRPRLTLSYRFNVALLDQWRALDDGLRNRTVTLLATAR